MSGRGSLEGKVALVTGGGRGLGAAICRALARDGATAIAADVDAGNAACVANEIRASGGRCEAIALNVMDERAAADAFAEALDRFNHIDALVNNAGIDRTAPVEEISVDEWDRIMAVNLRGPFVMSQLALPVMRRQGQGSIVNIVSTAARRAWANASAYHASKWGLLGFSHALHVEGREHGVKVTAIIAGGMRTPFLLDRFPDIDEGCLQDPANVAETVRYVLTQPAETVIPELMVLPMRETSWP